MATGEQLSRSFAGASDEYFEFTCSSCKHESKFMEAEVFCEDCLEYLCRPCLIFHNKFEKMKAHRMVNKDGMKSQGQRKSLSVPTETCEKHHGRLLDTYCHDHDEICCVTCVSLKHVTCKALTPGKEHNVKLQDEESCSIISMCQMKDGTIILSDYDNTNLKRLDTSYHVRDYLKLPSHPSQVCCSGVNELAVALHLEQEIRFVSVTDKMQLTSRKFSTGDWNCIGVAYSGDTLFVSCWKFCRSKCNVYSRKYDRLKLFSKSGDLLNTVANDSKGQPLFQNIKGLFVSEYDGCVYIADRMTGVLRLDRHGKLLATYVSNTLNFAMNVCDLGKEALLVCDFKNNSVLKLDRNMTSSTKLLGKNDGIIRPYSALVDRKTSKLLVGMQGYANILVFDLV